MRRGEEGSKNYKIYYRQVQRITKRVKLVEVFKKILFLTSAKNYDAQILLGDRIFMSILLSTNLVIY